MEIREDYDEEEEEEDEEGDLMDSRVTE